MSTETKQSILSETSHDHMLTTHNQTIHQKYGCHADKQQTAFLHAKTTK